MAIDNPTPTPMESIIKFSKENCPKSIVDKAHMYPYPYSQLVRNFMHAIVNSRSDCAFTICSLAQYMSN